MRAASQLRAPGIAVLLAIVPWSLGCGTSRPDPASPLLAKPYSAAEFESVVETEIAVLESTCDRGDGLACHEAAMLWRDAFGSRSLTARPEIQRLDERAVELLAPACEEDDGQACYTLGEILADPANRGRDPKRASESFTRARTLLPPRCEERDMHACGALVAILGDGLGGPVDARGSDEIYLEALALSAAACEAGDVQLCDRHHVWWYGWMAVPDEAAALAHLESARDLFRAECDKGSAKACEKLAQTYAWADLRDGSEDPWKARRAFQKACQLGHAGACVEAGLLWNQKSKQRDRSRAREYLQRGCDGGDADGCVEAADLCLRADPAVTRAFLERACDLGSATGCRRLADMLEQGYGGAPDPQQARAVLAKVRDVLTPGCDFGTGLHAAEACTRLGDLLSQGAGSLAEPAAARVVYSKARSIYEGECRAGDGFSCLVAADLAERGVAGDADPGESGALHQLVCRTNLAQELCRDGKFREDITVEITFEETTISFSY